MFETEDKSKQKNDGAVIEDENLDGVAGGESTFVSVIKKYTEEILNIEENNKDRLKKR